MLRFLTIVLICGTGVLAQDSLYTLKVDVSMVSVDVAVFNNSEMPVPNLTKQDFVIYEDGRRQEIQSFASLDTPYNVLLVVDRSGSMASVFNFLINAVNRFIANLRGQDRFALATFDNSVHRLVQWRSVRSGSAQTVKLDSGGDTNFYSALSWAADELRKVRGRKAALFFTDGEDYRIYESQVDAKAFNRALQDVRRANAPFHFVGLNADPMRGGARIKTVAELTGGQAHFPERMEEIVSLYDQISRELGISYTLGYLSDKPTKDGTYRRIEVAVPGGSYRISQSRSGYSAN
jgi:VWFA-related protein